jgi:hypothetical protein
MHATCPAHLILIDLTTLILLGAEWKLLSVSLRNFLHPPVTSSLFGQNILFSTLFWNTLSLCSSHNVRGQVSQPYRTTDKIIVLGNLIFTFLHSRYEIRHENSSPKCLQFRIHRSRSVCSPQVLTAMTMKMIVVLRVTPWIFITMLLQNFHLSTN